MMTGTSLYRALTARRTDKPSVQRKWESVITRSKLPLSSASAKAWSSVICLMWRSSYIRPSSRMTRARSSGLLSRIRTRNVVLMNHPCWLNCLGRRANIPYLVEKKSTLVQDFLQDMVVWTHAEENVIFVDRMIPDRTRVDET